MTPADMQIGLAAALPDWEVRVRKEKFHSYITLDSPQGLTLSMNIPAARASRWVQKDITDTATWATGLVGQFEMHS